MNSEELVSDIFSKMQKADPSGLDKLADEFTLSGPFPHPVNKHQWLQMVKNMNVAFTNFSYNVGDFQQVEEGKITFTLQVSGEHTGVLQVPNMEPIQPTNKSVKNPKESVTAWISDNVVEKIEITPVEGGGLAGVISQIKQP